MGIQPVIKKRMLKLCHLMGYTCFQNNSGAVRLVDGEMVFRGHTVFHNNSKENGGAIESVDGSLSFSGTTIFTNNTATGDSGGGALCVLETRITMKGDVSFSFNSAKNGGAASNYGGIIYYRDRVIETHVVYGKHKKIGHTAF